VSLEKNPMVIFIKWLTEVPVLHCAPTLWSLHLLTWQLFLSFQEMKN